MLYSSEHWLLQNSSRFSIFIICFLKNERRIKWTKTEIFLNNSHIKKAVLCAMSTKSVVSVEKVIFLFLFVKWFNFETQKGIQTKLRCKSYCEQLNAKTENETWKKFFFIKTSHRWMAIAKSNGQQGFRWNW